jgi:phage terminase Nu1 subunit (DNA packaging protein)
MTTCTKSEFAALLGKDKSYVTRLGQAGRLVIVGEGKGAKVDVEASKALLAESADPSRSGSDEIKPQAPAKPVHSSYNDARTRNELAKAQTAELDLAVKQGKLVDAEEARLFAADLAATFRGALEILPDRLAPELVPLNETETIRAVLVESFEQVLTDLADKINKWWKV